MALHNANKQSTLYTQMRICKSAFLQYHPTHKSTDLTVSISDENIIVSAPWHTALEYGASLSYHASFVANPIYGVELVGYNFTLDYTQTKLNASSSLIDRKTLSLGYRLKTHLFDYAVSLKPKIGATSYTILDRQNGLLAGLEIAHLADMYGLHWTQDIDYVNGKIFYLTYLGVKLAF